MMKWKFNFIQKKIFIFRDRKIDLKKFIITRFAKVTFAPQVQLEKNQKKSKKK